MRCVVCGGVRGDSLPSLPVLKFFIFVPFVYKIIFFDEKDQVKPTSSSSCDELDQVRQELRSL